MQSPVFFWEKIRIWIDHNKDVKIFKCTNVFSLSDSVVHDTWPGTDPAV